MTNLGNGAWPVVPAAFTNAGEPDRDAQRAVNEWYLSKGVPGLFAVSLSGEMYQLNETERLAQARWAVEDAAGRIPALRRLGGDHGVSPPAARSMRSR